MPMGAEHFAMHLSRESVPLSGINHRIMSPGRQTSAAAEGVVAAREHFPATSAWL